MTAIDNTADPLVSIVIAYYNGPSLIGEAVLSAKQQTYSNIEIIVVDDGSAMPAESVLHSIANIAIIRTENHGVSAARNLGFQRSSGEYLIFLDQDDHLLPGAIEAHLNVLRDQPNAALSFGAMTVIDSNNNEVHPVHICRPRTDYFLMLLETNPIATPGATMIRRDAFLDAGMYDPAFSSAGEDYYLYLSIARRKPLARHTFCVLEYRKHSANVSNDQEKMLAGVLAVLDRIEPLLTDSERKRLPHARRRWKHACRYRSTFGYRLWSLYFSFRAMLTVPTRYYFGNEI
jgi:glycosyltransferase involved in cell wall biosynthesis